MVGFGNEVGMIEMGVAPNTPGGLPCVPAWYGWDFPNLSNVSPFFNELPMMHGYRTQSLAGNNYSVSYRFDSNPSGLPNRVFDYFNPAKPCQDGMGGTYITINQIPSSYLDYIESTVWAVLDNIFSVQFANGGVQFEFSGGGASLIRVRYRFSIGIEGSPGNWTLLTTPPFGWSYSWIWRNDNNVTLGSGEGYGRGQHGVPSGRLSAFASYGGISRLNVQGGAGTDPIVPLEPSEVLPSWRTYFGADYVGL
jgi:hypothetical protein